MQLEFNNKEEEKKADIKRISLASSIKSNSQKNIPMTKGQIIKFMFCLIGANASLINNVGDILYVYSMKFERDLIFNIICIFILARLAVTISVFLGWFTLGFIQKLKSEKEKVE